MTQNEIILSIIIALFIVICVFLVREILLRYTEISQLKNDIENYKLRLENPIDKVMFPKLEEMFRKFGEATNEKDN